MDRIVELPGGRTLTVRPVRRDDLESLLELYRGLTVDDLRRRFFSVYRPTRKFVANWINALAERGFGMVAEVSQAGGRSIVADVGYVLLADGSGEFAITVDPRWRGWLGPYLLDALVQEAAERGVPGLCAEILVENRQMLALVRSRGFVTVDPGDWTTIRVMLGTSTVTPVWVGPHDRPRVLVEGLGGRWRAQEPARDAGYQVLVCPGPGPSQPHCPAIRGEPCPLVSESDVVVFALPPDDAHVGLLDAHARLHGHVPVCLTVALGQEPPDPGEHPAAVVTTERNPQRLIELLGEITGGPPVEPSPEAAHR